jgi:Zn-dependent protease with chaperone function
MRRTTYLVILTKESCNKLMNFLVKQIKTWLVILSLCIPIMIIGNSLAHREGLLIGLIVSFILLFFSLYHHPKNPISEFKGKLHKGRDPWHLNENTETLCEQIKIIVPEIYILPQDAPFILVVSPTFFKASIAFSMGLLEKLSSIERETLLILALTTLKKKSEWPSSIFERCGLTLLSMLEFFEKTRIFNSILRPILQPLICLFFKLSHSPAQQLNADQYAKSFIQNPEFLAQALWKIYGALAIHELKINPCYECYFLVLPESSRRSLFQFHPNIEKRLKNLVGYFPI